jgi:hypothetical protein
MGFRRSSIADLHDYGGGDAAGLALCGPHSRLDDEFGLCRPTSGGSLMWQAKPGPGRHNAEYGCRRHCAQRASWPLLRRTTCCAMSSLTLRPTDGAILENVSHAQVDPTPSGPPLRFRCDSGAAFAPLRQVPVVGPRAGRCIAVGPRPARRIAAAGCQRGSRNSATHLYLEPAVVGDAAEQGRDAARELPKAEKLAQLLFNASRGVSIDADQLGDEDYVEDYLWIERGEARRAVVRRRHRPGHRAQGCLDDRPARLVGQHHPGTRRKELADPRYRQRLPVVGRAGLFSWFRFSRSAGSAQPFGHEVQRYVRRAGAGRGAAGG